MKFRKWEAEGSCQHVQHLKGKNRECKIKTTRGGSTWKVHYTGKTKHPCIVPWVQGPLWEARRQRALHSTPRDWIAQLQAPCKVTASFQCGPPPFQTSACFSLAHMQAWAHACFLTTFMFSTSSTYWGWEMAHHLQDCTTFTEDSSLVSSIHFWWCLTCL